MNMLVKVGVDLFNAVAALKLKRHWLETSREGLVIHQAGKPDLLLTHEAARRFANEIAEAEQ